MDYYKLNENTNFFNYSNNLDTNLNNIHCINCGDKGHFVKTCKGPITSFGIIAFKIVNNSFEEKYDLNEYLKYIVQNTLNHNDDSSSSYPKIKFLMIQRKDTMGYIDLIRGKYDNRPGHEYDKLKKIKTCIGEMTLEEKNNILTLPFDIIWDNLWVNKDSRTYKNEKNNAKKKFLDLDIKSLIQESLLSNNNYITQEFSFAKGRRSIKETNLACAEREFHEETRFTKNDYEFINDYPIIVEEFKGTNDIMYKHVYYLVKMKSNICKPIVDKTNILQMGEVKNIGWFTINECLALIRPYDIAKKNIITDIYNNISKFTTFNCSSYYSYTNNKHNASYHNLNKIYNSNNSYLIEQQF